MFLLFFFFSSIIALKADINNISLMILQKNKRFDELYFTESSLLIWLFVRSLITGLLDFDFKRNERNDSIFIRLVNCSGCYKLFVITNQGIF